VVLADGIRAGRAVCSLARSLLKGGMLTLTDINRALDRLGMEIFIPRTRRQLALRVAPGSVYVDRDPERAVLGFPRRLAVVVPLRPRCSRDDAIRTPSAALRSRPA